MMPCNTTVSKHLHNWSYIALKVSGNKTRASLGSGSFHSILSAELARRFRIKSEPLTEETDHALFAANGSTLKLLGRAHVTLDVNQLRLQHEVIISPNVSEPFILGRYFLFDAGAVLDFKNSCMQTVNFQDKPLVLCENQKLGHAEHFDYSQKCFLVSDAKNRPIYKTRNDELNRMVRG
jgi:hypothetical protein